MMLNPPSIKFKITCVVIRLGVIFIGSIIISFLGFLPLSNNAGPYNKGNWMVRECSAVNLTHSLPKAVIIDARTHNEFLAGHISGAISLSPERWDELLVDFLSAWSPERPVVVYCGGQACGLSKEVALKILSNLPDAKVFVLKGGYPAWQDYQAKKDPAAL